MKKYSKNKWGLILIAGLILTFGCSNAQTTDQRLTLTTIEDGFQEASHKGAYRAVADLLAEWYGKPGKSIRAMEISLNYFDAGDYDLAIDWLEKAYEGHDPNLSYLGLPYYDPLRSYPRFQELLRKMNLPVDEKE